MTVGDALRAAEAALANTRCSQTTRLLAQFIIDTHGHRAKHDTLRKCGACPGTGVVRRYDGVGGAWNGRCEQCRGSGTVSTG